jgi:hypothetical protein
MKVVRFVFIILCCIGAAYGYWGAFTSAGNERYDGMEALLPFYVMMTSLGLLLIMGLYYLLLAVIKRGRRS